jgi:23S rRNA pseudouridine1911/1915/1917 synthase
MRLDLFLVQKFHISRNYAHFLIKNNAVYLDQKLIKKKHQQITIENMIEIKKTLTDIPNIKFLQITDDFLVIDKPYGLVCCRSATTHKDTLVLNELVASQYTLSSATIPEEFGLPHRIDKDTEGLMILSRTDQFYEQLKNDFKNHTIKKTYTCIVLLKQPLKEKDTIKMNLFYGNNQVLVSPEGVESIMSYKVIATYGKYAVLSVNPITGRRHQIRVMLSNLGCPIVGDTLYGGKQFKRLCLFSSILSHKDFYADLYEKHIHDINNLVMNLIL